MELQFRNVESAYNRTLQVMKTFGVERNSRNGKVLTLEQPALFLFRDPTDRVLLDPKRNANPFFHLMEALWMLTGSNEVDFVGQFNKQIYTYSDDGKHFNGAYGYRWRQHFGYDQIARSCEMLKKNQDDRRVVITMWDPNIDLGSVSKDIPCNTQAVFRLDGGLLQMMTTNRSNDLIWGLLGANYVHMTILMEYMAARIGCPIGPWAHVSGNLHIYEHHWPLMETERNIYVEYAPRPKSCPLVQDPEAFDQDCRDLVAGKTDYFTEPFFDGTVAPMIQAWQDWKGGLSESALTTADCIEDELWRRAAVEWLKRAQERKDELHAKTE